jgi:hypothetical protein
MNRLCIHPKTRSLIRASLRDAMAPEEVLTGVLKNALEHVAAAIKCRASMPDSDAAPEEHAKAVVELHAHVKAADRYLEIARRASGPMKVGDEDTEVAESADPAGRAMRQVTRATAAAVLVASGNIEGAQRPLRMPNPPTRRH